MAAGRQQTQIEEEDTCWICMSGGEAGELAVPCKCPPSRAVHERCLARWQLQRAGRSEETHCRFCKEPYGDWRARLTPRVAPGARPAIPIMAISFEGQLHYIKVYPGPEGKKRFEQQIRELIHLKDDEDFDVEFECKAPDSGTTLHLDGIDAFDAATHCASLTAAERLNKQHQQQQQLRKQQQEAVLRAAHEAEEQQRQRLEAKRCQQLGQQHQQQGQGHFVLGSGCAAVLQDSPAQPATPTCAQEQLTHQQLEMQQVQQLKQLAQHVGQADEPMFEPVEAADSTTQVQLQTDSLACPMSYVMHDRWSNGLD